MVTKICPGCDTEKPENAFGKHANRSGGLQIYCRSCKKVIDAKYYQANKQAQYARNKKYWEKHKAYINDYKRSQGCLICNECEPCCLDFHHPNKDKEGDVATLMLRNWEKTLAEIKKCVVVCASCHRKIHAGLIDLAP